MTDYEVELEAASAITNHHNENFDLIVGHADTFPQNVEGHPEATPLLLTILSLISADAHSIAMVNLNAADRMATTVDEYDGIEDAAAEEFDTWAEEIG